LLYPEVGLRALRILPTSEFVILNQLIHNTCRACHGTGLSEKTLINYMVIQIRKNSKKKVKNDSIKRPVVLENQYIYKKFKRISINFRIFDFLGPSTGLFITLVNRRMGANVIRLF